MADHADHTGGVLVTKDSDFVDSHLLHGRPLKLLLISTGNISNAALEAVLRPMIPEIAREFDARSFLEVTRTGVHVRA